MYKFSLFFFLLLFPFYFYAQEAKVSSSADRNEMKIGEQFQYKITVEADSTVAQTSFPKGNAFYPFEVISESKIDTFREKEKFRLVKEYTLTQFDSGHYVLPSLPISINQKEYLTDSLRFVVHNVMVDTLKQPLYQIKAAMEVKRPATGSSLLWHLLWFVPLLLALAFFAYWRFFRKKKLKEEDIIAALPPFDRALLKLKNLQNSRYLIESNHKEYYSVLTDIIRRYLEEEIHISATESTTEELLTKLQMFLDAGKLHLSQQVLDDLRGVLRKADLVKFAKSQPADFEAESDRKSIETIVVKTNEGLLPQLQGDMDVQLKQAPPKGKSIIYRIIHSKFVVRRLIAFGIGVVLLIVAILWTFLFRENKGVDMEQWITSSYGYPAVTIATPEVLIREKKANELDRFLYRNPQELSVMLITNNLRDYISELAQQGEENQEENALKEKVLKMIESELKKQFKGENILIKDEPYTTVRGVEGYKVFGSFISKDKNERIRMNYQSYFFIRGEFLQMILFTYPEEKKELGISLVERIMTTVVIR